MKRFHKPIRVAPKERRTYNHVTYHSIAEMAEAQRLDIRLRDGAITEWFRQVPIQLGAIQYKTDFVVVALNGHVTSAWDPPWRLWAEDVKGYHSKAFTTTAKLWRSYARFPLVVVDEHGKWVEVIEGEAQR